MKRVEIRYHYIRSDHLLAVPEFCRKEVVEYTSAKALRKYIESQKDEYGHPFKESKDNFAGFDYVSKAGGVKVKMYKPQRIKKI